MCSLVFLPSSSTRRPNFAHQGEESEIWHLIQGGPLPVLSGVITPINGLIKMGNWGEKKPPYRSCNSTFNWIRGPHCTPTRKKNLFLEPPRETTRISFSHGWQMGFNKIHRNHFSRSDFHKETYLLNGHVPGYLLPKTNIAPWNLWYPF